MRRTSREDIGALAAELGIRRGDRIMVHCFLPSLGYVEGGLAGLEGALRDTIGPEGTLMVPTFTYSFRRGEEFDIRRSKSTVGAFSEHVRTRDGAVRSPCPLFSMAGVGPDAGRLLHRRSPRCFGEGSVFETLFADGVKFVGFGVDYDQGYSFFMHLERLAEIPHRRDATFHGACRDRQGRTYEDEAIHFSRVDDPPWKRNRGRVCEELVRTGVVREVVVDGCAHRLFEAAAVHEAVLERLKCDPWCMADRL